ncbi:hypothetical protein, partial [Cellulomonas shaoxiangyii]
MSATVTGTEAAGGAPAPTAPAGARVAVLAAAVALAPTAPEDASGARAAEASAGPVAAWCDLR